ncbi:tigger transposable element-derived protein 1 [Trichonephila clavipes]|nr:tigger transposable element-derived protein 1 [Trichonephila clavipes]
MAEPNEFGNVIEEIVDLVRQISLEVDSDDVKKLLGSHNHELAIDELIELHEQDIEEFESLDPIQSEDRITIGNLTGGLSLIEKRLQNTVPDEMSVFSTEEGI